MNQTTDYLTVSTAGRELVDITGKVYAWLDRHDATTGLLTVADRDLGRGAQYESCDDHAVTTAVADVKKKGERPPSPRRQGRRRPHARGTSLTAYVAGRSAGDRSGADIDVPFFATRGCGRAALGEDHTL